MQTISYTHMHAYAHTHKHTQLNIFLQNKRLLHLLKFVPVVALLLGFPNPLCPTHLFLDFHLELYLLLPAPPQKKYIKNSYWYASRKSGSTKLSIILYLFICNIFYCSVERYTKCSGDTRTYTFLININI